MQIWSKFSRINLNFQPSFLSKHKILFYYILFLWDFMQPKMYAFYYLEKTPKWKLLVVWQIKKDMRPIIKCFVFEQIINVCLIDLSSTFFTIYLYFYVFLKDINLGNQDTNNEDAVTSWRKNLELLAGNQVKKYIF